jgi:F-type H+-transporting ATPase subunit b
VLFLIAQAAEVAAESSGGGIGSIGLDVRSLVLQIVNFAILLLVLKKFAYKPIMDTLDARRHKIEESLKTAKELEIEKVNMQKEKDALIKEAHGKAQVIIEQSKKQAQDIIVTAEIKSRERDEQLFHAANARILQETELVKKSLLGEATKFVSEAAEKILNKKLDTASDMKIIKEAISETEIV